MLALLLNRLLLRFMLHLHQFYNFYLQLFVCWCFCKQAKQTLLHWKHRKPSEGLKILSRFRRNFQFKWGEHCWEQILLKVLLSFGADMIPKQGKNWIVGRLIKSIAFKQYLTSCSRNAREHLSLILMDIMWQENGTISDRVHFLALTGRIT